MTPRERAQETLYLITREMSTERLREISAPLPADVGEAAKDFALAFLPGVAQQFIDEMTATNVSVPYELLAIAKGRELAENETTNEVTTSENN
ncbi:hypothetical protein NG701_07595 [Pseudarthrobacter sp. HLT3-5]|uniref:hypothetical protein n=1 Tax=Pseudarthrobacter cellobiosi TaxID=2953654 RepID=UPI00208E75D8|nr:hypothetical protein [Pseudarthrobacter sp. HLT3-5]MCO4274292.1 hypothetical protein [Pseudarthrobacter sp. HLT3-5]